MQGIIPTSFTDRKVFSPVPHAVIHVPRITTSLLFKNFFLAAQFASWSGTADPVSLAVHLIGGESVVLPSVGTLDREELVKEVGRGSGVRMREGWEGLRRWKHLPFHESVIFFENCMGNE